MPVAWSASGVWFIAVASVLRGRGGVGLPGGARARGKTERAQSRPAPFQHGRQRGPRPELSRSNAEGCGGLLRQPGFQLAQVGTGVARRPNVLILPAGPVLGALFELSQPARLMWGVQQQPEGTTGGE